jgi:cell division protein FtsL
MATLATMYNRILGARTYGETAPHSAVEETDHAFLLRSIPNEDVYFYIKDINNSRVVREADPRARLDCWKLIATAGLSALLLIGILLPSAYGVLAGYRIQSLKTEQQRLLNERSALDLEEAKLLSPQRLAELAKMQAFTDPGPQSVIYLDSKSGSLAMNVKKPQ